MEQYEHWLSLLRARGADLLQSLVAYFPDLIAALGVLLGGWIVGRVVRLLLIRFGSGVEQLIGLLEKRAGRPLSRLRWPLTPIVADIAHWLIFLAAVTFAAQLLGLTGLAVWLRELFLYLPRILISILILFIGYLLSGTVRDVTAALSRSKGFRYGLSVGRVLAGLVLAFALLLSLDKLGLDVTLLINIITLLAAGLFGGAALAFGIGSGDSVRNIIAGHYVRNTYRVGQILRVNDIEGEILEMSPVAVVLETRDGAARIPARVFNQSVSVLLEDEEEKHE
jgi:small-conductance mechanosensitive channel